MTRRLLWIALTGFFIAATFIPAQAKGRRPDDEGADKFPDYNRLEMHPKPKEAPSASNDYKPVPPAPSPSLNAPANLTNEDDTVPKPAPAAVPVPDSSSEPPLPGDMQDTLIPSATNQK